MTMFQWDDDGRAGEWIAGRLGEFGTVGGNVPNGFESYVSIPNSADPDEPSDGGIDPEDDGARLQALLDVLVGSTPASLHYALWNGYGFLQDPNAPPALSFAFLEWDMPPSYPAASGVLETVGPAVPGQAPLEDAAARSDAPPGGARPVALPTGLVERPSRVHLSLPHREYSLWSGDRSSAWAFRQERQSPTMFWPADRSWFVHSDLDAARTEIGGPAALLEPLLGSDWGGRTVLTTDPITAVWDTHPTVNSVGHPPEFPLPSARHPGSRVRRRIAAGALLLVGAVLAILTRLRARSVGPKGSSGPPPGRSSSG